MANFSDLVGQTIIKIVGGTVGSDEVYFETSDGKMYKMYHEQNCCEHVQLEDICGDISDLIGSPIVQAEESSSEDIIDKKPIYPDSFTWTFYRIATAKGLVVLRWLGESNGYYSETVDFEQLNM